MRLIDADELLKNYQTICSSIRCNDCQFNGVWGDKGCQLEALIKDASTVDAEPIRHGRWIFNPKDDRERRLTLSRCSWCGAESLTCGNYCSYCGARMDG